MRTQEPRDILVQRLDERRYALTIDGIVRYVSTEEECQRRLGMLFLVEALEFGMKSNVYELSRKVANRILSKCEQVNRIEEDPFSASLSIGGKSNRVKWHLSIGGAAQRGTTQGIFWVRSAGH